MANENKWEYDYSSQNNTGGTDTGYPNVGSSGMNTANQYNDPQPQYTAPNVPPMPDAGAGGVTPPVYPAQPQQAQPPKPKKKKKFNGGRVARSAVALVLAAAMGFAGGFVGAKYGGSGKVVIQQAAPSAASDSSTGSSGADSTITAASSSGSSLTTEQVADMVSPSVVVITTEQVVYSQWSWYGQSQVESGAGSGVIISSDGYILTCAHVVDGASSITVTIDDKDYTATLVGEDATSDVAVIKIDATGLTPATVGDSDNLKVGQSVMAVGNPLGELGGTVTGGMISALNRSVTIQGTSSTNTMSLIQMDASVSPGNSGGGLFNMNGELIGIVNAKSSSSDAEGLGFAIPINDVKNIISDLIQYGYVTGKPYMGITGVTMSASVAQQYGVTNAVLGVYVATVEDGSCSAKAGLQPGDIITAMDEDDVVTFQDLEAAKATHQAGDTVTLTVFRNGEKLELSLTLDEQPRETVTDTSSQQQQQPQQNNQYYGWPFGGFFS